jgi:hypothetical protein
MSILHVEIAAFGAGARAGIIQKDACMGAVSLILRQGARCCRAMTRIRFFKTVVLVMKKGDLLDHGSSQIVVLPLIEKGIQVLQQRGIDLSNHAGLMGCHCIGTAEECW